MRNACGLLRLSMPRRPISFQWNLLDTVSVWTEIQLCPHNWSLTPQAVIIQYDCTLGIALVSKKHKHKHNWFITSTEVTLPLCFVNKLSICCLSASLVTFLTLFFYPTLMFLSSCLLFFSFEVLPCTGLHIYITYFILARTSYATYGWAGGVEIEEDEAKQRWGWRSLLMKNRGDVGHPSLPTLLVSSGAEGGGGGSLNTDTVCFCQGEKDLKSNVTDDL